METSKDLQVSCQLENVEKSFLTIIKNVMKINEKNINPKEEMSCTGINSIKFIQIMIEIEGHYDIEIEDEYLNLEKFANLSNVLEYIKCRIKTKYE